MQRERIRTIPRACQSPGNLKHLYATVPGSRSRGDIQQPTLILQVGEDAPRSFMSNEVAEEVCRFREVLGRLMLNGKCEFELIFIFDCLYEDGALLTPRLVRRLRNSE